MCKSSTGFGLRGQGKFSFSWVEVKSTRRVGGRALRQKKQNYKGQGVGERVPQCSWCGGSQEKGGGGGMREDAGQEEGRSSAQEQRG